MILLFMLAILVGDVSYAQDSNNPAENPQFKEAIKDFQSSRLVEARKGLLNLLEREPKQQIYWFNLGHTYYKLNNFSKASECYQKVRELEGSLALHATYYQAVCENNRGRSKKALELIKAVIEDSKSQENLRIKAVHFKRAVNDEDDEASIAALKYFNEGEYEQSLKEIDKSDLSETPEAFLLRGMNYKNLHKNEEAKKYLQLTERYSQKEDLRESSRALAADLNEKETPSLPSGFSGDIIFNGGSDSNIYQVKSATDSGIIEWNAEVNYRRNLSSQLFLIPSYSFKQSRYLKSSSLNSTDHFFILALGYNPAQWYFEMAPFFELNQSSYDLFSFGTDYLVKLENEKWTAGFSGTISQQKTSTTTENYLNGQMRTAKIFFELKNSGVTGQIYAASTRASIGDLSTTLGTQNGILPLAYSGTESGLYTVISIKTPWKFYGRVSVANKDYDTISTPTNVKRKDITTNLFIKAKYAFNHDWSGFVSLNYFNNQSTLGASDVENKNYSELINKFGMQWSW